MICPECGEEINKIRMYTEKALLFPDGEKAWKEGSTKAKFGEYRWTYVCPECGSILTYNGDQALRMLRESLLESRVKSALFREKKECC